MGNESEQNEMSIAQNRTPTIDFRVGAVLSKTVGVFSRNLVPFFLLAALFIVPLYILQYYMFLKFSGQEIVLNGWLGFGVTIAEIFIAQLVTATLIYGSIQELRGTRSSMAECFRRGLPLVLPVIGVSIVAYLIVMLGMIALIIPGLIAAIMLSVVIPVTVVERPGIFASIGRSKELTKGYRWRIFGVFLLIYLGIFAVNYAAYTIFGLIANVDVTLASVEPENWVLGTLFLNAFIGPLTIAFYSVMIAVVYHDLRISKEGGDTDQIAAVFD